MSDEPRMTGMDKEIFNATRTLTTLLNDACNHWNYLCPYLEKLAGVADDALRGYQKDYPEQVAELIDYRRERDSQGDAAAWKETCAKCIDGEIEPRHCKYYGEPNGCNSPTYGEYPPVGNTAAMREALVLLSRIIGANGIRGNVFLDDIQEAHRAITAALSAPARNCDVGTAEEQAVRFRDVCNKYYDDENPCNKKCPMASLDIIHGFPRCQSYWAQMPYEAEEGGAK